jgi:L-seryl-tRNA(Ser) seleniumtransferase
VDDPRRRTPRVDLVLGAPELSDSVRRLGRDLVKAEVVRQVDRCREGDLEPDRVVDAVRQALPRGASSLRAVVNATGVVVHTNLGRAPLSAAAIEAVAVAAGATDVELDLDTGERGRRGAAALAALASAVPEAEGTHVVNNGAAALALAALGLARDREVVIARGEMVEIGDGFRIPELLESVGAHLREVGTTNRVRVEDYAAAVDDSTGMVLKVHPSNFRVEGFTASASVADLSRVLVGSGVPLVVDIGSGLLAPHRRLPEEPDATTTLRDGADLVTASGDKLLGGPQCGLLLGREDLVTQLRRHPFARAVRVDKLTLAALEATLTGPPAPVPEALSADPDVLWERACRLARDIGSVHAEAVTSEGRVGGGGAPGVVLPSAAVALPQSLAAPLRRGTTPVVGHVSGRRLLLDLLTITEEQEASVVDAVLTVLKQQECR